MAWLQNSTKRFLGLIGSDLVHVINYVFENENLISTMRRGVIVLLWKGHEENPPPKKPYFATHLINKVWL